MPDAAVLDSEKNAAKTETFPMTCIICPMGCTMEVTTEGEGENRRVVSVADNTCPRGPEYAKMELLHPMRTITTTIRVLGGEMPLVPVKTKGEVPKNMQLQCMEVIRRAKATAPVTLGQVLVHDILGTGIPVVACADVAKA